MVPFDYIREELAVTSTAILEDLFSLRHGRYLNEFSPSYAVALCFEKGNGAKEEIKCFSSGFHMIQTIFYKDNILQLFEE